MYKISEKRATGIRVNRRIWKRSDIANTWSQRKQCAMYAASEIRHVLVLRSAESSGICLNSTYYTINSNIFTLQWPVDLLRTYNAEYRTTRGKIIVLQIQCFTKPFLTLHKHSLYAADCTIPFN